MANTHQVLQGVKDYTLDLLGTEFRDVAVAAAGRSESAATRSEGAAESVMGDAAATAADRVATGEDRAQTGEDREAAEQWAGQSKDAATLAITAAATASQYVGTGFPEGKVTAPVGATYTDTAATNGAVRWIKTSGTGNTGWKIEYGDTGWRDISSSIEDRMSPLEFTDGARLLIRRIGDLAYLKISGRAYVRNQFGKLCDNFTGFRPEGYAQVNFSKAADINAGVWQIRVESGTVDGEITSGADRSIMGYWDVAQAWPTTLPGIPA